MTLPGEIEHVPTKVVPFFVTGYDEVEVETASEEPVEEPPRRERPASRSSVLGQLALCVALATIGVHIAAVIVAASGSFVAGTVLAWIAIAASILAVLSGLVAIIGRFGRGWGISAVILGVVANPFLLVNVLNFVGGS